MRLRSLTVSGAASLVLATASVASAQSAAPSPGSARLEGKFVLYSSVTVAQDIPGEHAGAHFLTSWAFTAQCSTGPCSSVILQRSRGHASDVLVLSRREPDYYVGTGSFYAPARCGSRDYRQGILAPFTIAVRVTQAGRDSAGEAVATRLSATYTGSKRINLTPCVAALGRDAASYHGHRQA